MARQQIQKCKDCGTHCLSTSCSKCGGIAQAAAPMKWSPEDTRAHLRRQINGVEESGWANTLPTLASNEEE
jgi:rRNA maturation protein Nop10